MWAILLWRRGLGVLHDLPMVDFIQFCTILRTAFGSSGSDSTSKLSVHTVCGDEECSKKWFGENLYSDQFGFRPASALPLLVSRHGWVF